jgi:signal transduction protein with GAF and PtsI domain
MTNLVSIPYMVEGDQMLEIAPFPLGEGLTSILIRTGKPLFLVEDVEQQAIALGAKVVGKLAKSWLGVPLLIGNEAVGAMIVQDVDQEGRFTEDNLRFMTTLSAQVAVVVRNANLLDRASKNAERQHNVVEISNRIRRSIDIETILKNTALEMGSLFNARRVKVELKLDELSPALPKSDDTLPR